MLLDDALAPELLAEIRRVFCVIGASGHLDSRALFGLMAELGKRQPEQAEVEMVMMALSAGGPDSVISLGQFEAALSRWLREQRGSSPVKKRKVGHDADSCSSPGSAGLRRRRVHADISAFFTQFRPRDGVTVRDLMESDGEDAGEVLGDRERTAKEKLELLHFISRTLASFSALVEGVRSDDAAAAGPAVAALERMLQVVEVFHTPAQRYAISPVLLQLFEAVTHAQLPRRLPALVAAAAAPLALRRAAARALRLYARGPRIAHTPRGCVWHQDAFLAKRVVVEAGALPPLLALLSCGRDAAPPGLRADALAALSAIGEDNAEALQLLHAHGVGGAVAALLGGGGGALTLEEARAATYAMAVLCGHTHAGGCPTREEAHLAPARATLQRLLAAADDWEVVANVAAAYAHVLAAGAAAPPPPSRAAAEAIQATATQLASALAPGGAAAAKRDAAVALLTCARRAVRGVTAAGGAAAATLPPLVCAALDDDGADVRPAALALAEALAAERALRGDAAAALCGRLLALVRAEDPLEARACTLAARVVADGDGAFAAARALHAHRAAPLLFATLRRVRRVDAVLEDAYGFREPSFDFALGLAALQALRALLAAGEAIAQQSASGSGGGGGNPLLDDFGADAVAALGNLVSVVVEEAQAGRLDRWRQDCVGADGAAGGSSSSGGSGASVSTNCSFEAAIEGLARDMAEAHAREMSAPQSAASLKASRAAAAMLADMSSRASAGATAAAVTPQLHQFMPPPAPASASGCNSLAQQAAGGSGAAAAAAAALPPGFAAGFMAGFGAAGPRAAAAAAAARQSAVNVTVTPLNFQGDVRVTLGAAVPWQELLRHCVVAAGRSVELLYLAADGVRHVAVTGQDDIRLALALAASQGHPGHLQLFMRAQFTQRLASRCATATAVPAVPAHPAALKCMLLDSAASPSGCESPGSAKRRSCSATHQPPPAYRNRGGGGGGGSVHSHKKQRSSGAGGGGGGGCSSSGSGAISPSSSAMEVADAAAGGSGSAARQRRPQPPESFSLDTDDSASPPSSRHRVFGEMAALDDLDLPAGSGSGGGAAGAGQPQASPGAAAFLAQHGARRASAGAVSFGAAGSGGGLQRTKRLVSRTAFVSACEGLSLSPRGSLTDDDGANGGGGGGSGGGGAASANGKRRSVRRWACERSSLGGAAADSDDSDLDEAADVATVVSWGALCTNVGGSMGGPAPDNTAGGGGSGGALRMGESLRRGSVDWGWGTVNPPDGDLDL